MKEQRQCIETYCREHELQLAEIIEDPGQSGTTWDRPGLRRLFEVLGVGDARPPSALVPHGRKLRRKNGELKRERIGVVVSKLDRLSRDAYDLMGLIRTGFLETHALYSVRDSVDTSSASGKFGLHILIITAQYERDVIAERTSKALQHVMNRGEHVGAVPYGWYRDRMDGHLRADHEKQGIIETLVQKRNEGISLQELANDLNLRGERGPGGGKWSRMAVGRVLLRSRPVVPATTWLSTL